MRKMINKLLHLILVAVLLTICSCASKQNSLNKQGDSTKQNPLTAEAQEEAKRFWDSLSVKCGDSYYAFARWEGNSLESLLEFKTFTVSVVEETVPSPTPPKPLSEADKLNQVEERKTANKYIHEWDGYIKLNVGANRGFNSRNGGWEKWQDEMPGKVRPHSSIGLHKVNGRWLYSQTYESVARYDYATFMKGISPKIECSQIKKYLKW
jgi:hypothetical protein